MEDQLINFKTAQLAKEKGFNINTLNFYDSNSSYTGYVLKEKTIHTPDSYYHHRDCFMAPTQSLLQKWLREVHQAHIDIIPEFYHTGINYNWCVRFYSVMEADCMDSRSTGLYGDNGEYPTYELALEAGLQKALKLITKKLAKH